MEIFYLKSRVWERRIMCSIHESECKDSWENTRNIKLKKNLCLANEHNSVLVDNLADAWVNKYEKEKNIAVERNLIYWENFMQREKYS